jgi:hypothetical protein
MKSPGITVRPIITAGRRARGQRGLVRQRRGAAPTNLIARGEQGLDLRQAPAARMSAPTSPTSNRAKRELERLEAHRAQPRACGHDARFRDAGGPARGGRRGARRCWCCGCSRAERRRASSRWTSPGLLKIRGSEIQQRYTELMMLAAGPTAMPFVREAMDAGWQGDQALGGHSRSAAHCAPLAGTYFNYRKTTIYGGSQRSATQHRRADGPGELKPWTSISRTTRHSLRDAVARWVDKGFAFERRHGDGRGPAARAARCASRTCRAGPRRPGRARGARWHGLRGRSRRWW